MVKSTYELLENDISFNCNALRLPDKIRDEAISILRKYLKKKNLQGRNLEQYCAGLIWLACKKWNYPITTKNINSVLDLDSTKSKSYMSVKVKGELIIVRVGKSILRVIEENIAPVTLDKYVEMIQSRIGSYPECYTRAMMLIDYMEKNNINVGYNNPALASALAYISDRIEGYRETEKNYAQIVGTTEISLRTYKRKLLKAIPNIRKRGTHYKWIDFPRSINTTPNNVSDCQDVQGDWWKSVTEMTKYDKS